MTLHCATHNEVDEGDAQAVDTGRRLIAEGSNRVCTQKVIHVFEET